MDANPDGHDGETREQRIEEFIEANLKAYVLGLREGSMLLIEDNHIHLILNRQQDKYNTKLLAGFVNAD